MSQIKKEDIYETEDVLVEQVENQTENRDDKNPDIEKIAIDIDGIMKKLGNRVLNLKSVDYSDSIAKKRRNFYGGGSYVLEVVGNEYKGKETTEQKLNRIVYEISELNEEISKSGVEKTDLLNDDTIKALSAEVNNLRIVKEISEGPQVETDKKVDIPVKSSSELSSLENRLRRLEDVLLTANKPSTPILNTVEDLKMRCEAINASYLDVVEEQLSKLISTMKQSSDTKNPELDKKVDEIHNMMAKWDVECSSLASNTKKVTSLRKLHEQAQTFAANLSHLKSVKEQLEVEITKGQAAIRETIANDQETVKNLTENLQKVEKLVSQLK